MTLTPAASSMGRPRHRGDRRHELVEILAEHHVDIRAEALRFELQCLDVPADVGQRARFLRRAHDPGAFELHPLAEKRLEQRRHEPPVRLLAKIRRRRPTTREGAFAALRNERQRPQLRPRDERLERRRLPGFLRLTRDTHVADRDLNGFPWSTSKPR